MTIRMILPFLLGLFVLFLCTYVRYYHVPKRDGYCFFVFHFPIELLCPLLLLVGSFVSNVAWADGSGSSYDPAELRQLSQPQVNEEGPPIEWGQDAVVFVPDIPVLEQPLLHDDLRRTQLYNRLAPHSFVQELPLNTIVDLVYQQAEVEKKIEACLILDGIPPMRFLYELNRLRGVLFYPQGTPLSPATLARYIREIAQSGTRQSIPYRRVYRAIRNYELFIDLIFNNNNQ